MRPSTSSRTVWLSLTETGRFLFPFRDTVRNSAKSGLPRKNPLASNPNDTYRLQELESKIFLRATRGRNSLKERDTSRPPQTSAVAEKVLVAKSAAFGTNIWPPFTLKYFGLCVVAKAKHPGYELTPSHERRSRSAIHARRLVLYSPR